jgi:hypothetical protein
MMRQFVFVLVLATVGLADGGVVDTVGGTCYDWQMGAQANRFIVNSRQHGVYVRWVYSNDTLGAQADRNIRTNFYDYATRRWLGSDTGDFMLFGWNVFTERSGLGNVDVDPVNGYGVFSCHQGSAPVHPAVAREIEPGTGIFEYCDGSPMLDGYLWPLTAVSRNRTIHMHCIDDASRDATWYSRAATWCNWSTPILASDSWPTLMSQNIAASKVSDKVCLTWVTAENLPCRLLYRTSPDGGDNWDTLATLGYPPAFGPDTGCSYYITSGFPLYDSLDRLHIVVDVMPIIDDTVWGWPNEIWHWCAENNPQWSRVHRANADPRGQYSPGANALLACRSSIGEDHRGNLFVTWEQFDTLNIEPLTNLMRAGIWIAGSNDNGLTWQPATRLTSRDSSSYRFPCVMDMAMDGRPGPDSVVVFYEQDLVAGFKSGSSPVGPWTTNPIIAHKIPADEILSGVVEERPQAPARATDLDVAPNPARQRVAISYAVPQAGDVLLAVHDVSGRLVKTLVSGRQNAGRYSLSWDASDAAPGIYFCTLTAAGAATTRKLVRSR